VFALSSAMVFLHKVVGINQAPPMPTVTLPVPWHWAHGLPPASLPDPPHTRQMLSPVPGVPAGASSPGLGAGAPLCKLVLSVPEAPGSLLVMVSSLLAF